MEKPIIEKHIAEINPHEMACRIAEAACGVKRAPGLSAQDALKQIEEIIGHESVQGFYRAAWAAAQYLEESINNMQKVQ